MRRSCCCAVAVVITLAVGGASAGATRVAGTATLGSAPFPAGRGVTWLAIAGGYALLTQQPGARAVTLASGALPSCSNLDPSNPCDRELCAGACRGRARAADLSSEVRLLASPRRWLLAHRSSNFTQYGGSVSLSLQSAALAPAAPRQDAGCSYTYGGGGGPGPPRPDPVVAVDGDVVAESCTYLSPLRVIDFGAPGAPATTVAANGDVSDAALAGRWLATLESGPPRQLVVRDWTTGTTALRIAGGDVSGFDVQSDGTLAIARVPAGRSCLGTLTWYSASDPTPHLLPQRTCEPAVALDAGQIAFVGGTKARKELDVVGLSGSGGPVARLRGVSPGAFSAADGRLAYATRECSSLTGLYNVPISSARVAALPPAECPITLRGNTAAVTHRGHVRIGVSCIRGCAGTARLQLLGRGTSIASNIRLGPSLRTRSLRFFLSGRQLARLPSGRRLRARLTLRVDRLDGGHTTTRVIIGLSTPA